MARPKEITKKLKVADSEIVVYVVELEKENLRLHKMVAKLQVECVSQNNEIKALKEQAKKPGINVVVQKFASSENETE